MTGKKALIVGAGLGGLATALRLRRRGYEVEMVEMYRQAGGRLNQLTSGGFTFDMAPTFFSMSYHFDEFVRDAGIEMPFRFVQIDPLYRVNFRGSDRWYTIYRDLDRLAHQFEDIEPGFRDRMARFLASSGALFDDIEKGVLAKNFRSLPDFMMQMTKLPVKHVPKVMRSVWSEMSRYFTSYEVRVIFSLVSFFLGATPFDTPAVYTILSYTEMVHDGYHNVEGGMYRIVDGLLREAEKAGIKINYNVTINGFDGSGRRNRAFIDTDGRRWEGDIFVINADAAMFRGRVFRRPAFTDEKLDRMQWTLAPLTIYLGVKGKMENIHHHNYFLGDRDYEPYSKGIFRNKVSLDKPYYYVNANAIFNPQSAPPGCENLFILVPVPDLRFKPDWSDRERIADAVIKDLSARTGHNVEANLMTRVVLDPVDWQNMFGLYRGSGLGLGHKMTQVGGFRPSNRDEMFSNVWYTGASTVPGTGLPMVIISSKLTVQRIDNEAGTL
ncbi:MAG: phytoene desaturase [Bacteroidales bacterium]|jgi:phytoene desaturase|nr:phytoene desaturase [Bacteroidales bacterium]MDX9927303.1 phytoene desaturase family protein [Bacteroidales bacterium]HOC47615.1 phytoene desaturase family protein [Bacteroidales bacterium]